MSLEVTTRALVRDLMPLDKIKNRLEADDSDNDLLGDFLTTASRLIEVELGRDLARQSYVETLPGKGRQRILLSRFPIDTDSLTVTINGEATTSFTVEDWRTGTLLHDSCWPSGDDLCIEATYVAGYVLPDSFQEWRDSEARGLGEWTQPSDPSTSSFLFEVTTAGTTGPSEPDWSTATAGGDTVTDNDITWTARRAERLPVDLEIATYLQTKHFFDGTSIPTGVHRVSIDDISETYSTQFDTPDVAPGAVSLTGAVRALLNGRRYG